MPVFKYILYPNHIHSKFYLMIVNIESKLVKNQNKSVTLKNRNFGHSMNDLQ